MMNIKVLKRIGCLAVILLSILLLQGTGTAETENKKTKSIKKLLQVSGIEEQLSYMKDGVLNSYSQMISVSYPKVPDAFWDEFNSLIGEKEMQALVDMVVPVYDKHMSEEVINNLIEMFENPFWKEWMQKMPIISREAGMAGQNWMQKHAQTDEFKKKIDLLVEKYELEKLNSGKAGSK